MTRVCVLGGLIWCGCVGVRPLSASGLREASTHSFEGAWDDVFDASWLVLESWGYHATEVDRAAGVVTLTHESGRGYALTVSSRGQTQLVSAVPRSSQPLLLGGPDGEDQKWERLWQETSHLLEAWHEAPEWRYDTRLNRLALRDFSLEPPRAWASIDFDVNRRRVRVKRSRGRQPGLNPTLLVVIDRRRPESGLVPLLQEAAGLALSATHRLTLPDDIEAHPTAGGFEGHLQLLDGTTPRPVRWHARELHQGAWTVSVVAACGDEAEGCEAEWAATLASVKPAP